MANDVNNADRLIERILSDAREDAEKTAGDAGQLFLHNFVLRICLFLRQLQCL